MLRPDRSYEVCLVVMNLKGSLVVRDAESIVTAASMVRWTPRRRLRLQLPD
jgi:hypothetical protein